MHNGRRRLPAEQASHMMRKRLSFSGWPAADEPVGPDLDPAPLVPRAVVTLTGPGFTITLSGAVQVTQNLPVPPTTTLTTQTTPLTTPIGTPSPPSPPPSSPPPSTSPTFTPPGSIPPPQPSASAVNPANNGSSEGVNTAPVSGVSASKPAGLPTGAIVGIAVACVLLVLGAFVFLVRQRAVQQRKLRRATATWLTQGAAGFAQPVPQPAGAFAGDMGEASPGVSFARAQAAALASRPASTYSPGAGPVAVPMPPPSSYGNAPPAAAPVAAGGAAATVRYEFIPSLPDELSIVTGEVVRIFSEYDDGWALCANARGEQGMVPIECLDRAARGALAPPDGVNRNSHRTSSLGVRY